MVSASIGTSNMLVVVVAAIAVMFFLKLSKKIIAAGVAIGLALVLLTHFGIL